MKKLISIMAACLLVFGFAGMASADYCAQCEGDDPGHINRGCEGTQDCCCPFDYEDFGRCSTQGWGGCEVSDYSDSDYCGPSYCESAGPKPTSIHRAIFELCDCYPDLKVGDTIYVSMEIMVDKGTGTPVIGDNGVYWAENVGTTGILVEAKKNQADVCADTDCTPDSSFTGDYNYLLANGNSGAVNSGNSCSISDKNRVVRIEPVEGNNNGFTLTDAGKSTLWIDIPWLRVDPARVMKGWGVYVKICIDRELTSICGDADCCCLIYIGELCCEDEVSENEVIAPYFTAADSGWWAGLALTNAGTTDASVMLYLYEDDGDSFALVDPIIVPANDIVALNHVALYGLAWNTLTSVDGTPGNGRYYVVAKFANSKVFVFAMMGKTGGESMGYFGMPLND